MMASLMIKILSIFFLLISVTRAYSAGKVNQPSRGLTEILYDMEKDTRQVEKGFSRNVPNADLVQTLTKLESDFSELKSVSPSKGDPDLWRQYCEVGGGISADTESQLNRSFRSAAQNSFSRLKKVEGDLIHDFGPGWWQRFVYRIKRIF